MTENEAIRELHNIRPRGSIIPQKRAEALDVAIQALEEIQQYRAIGTIEDFKALKEKSVAKKVAYQGEHEKCPNCGSFHVFGKHCTECGQAVDYD